MTFALISLGSDRYLSEDGLNYCPFENNAMKFHTWEDANEYNEEFYSGELAICDLGAK